MNSNAIMLNCTLLCTVKQHSTEILILSPDLIPHELLCLHRPVGRRVEKRGGEGRESGGEKGKKKKENVIQNKTPKCR